MRMTLANYITIGRALLIPVFLLLMVYYIDEARHGTVVPPLRQAALAVFLLASVSDALDGFIARRFHQASALGRILDPIADKLLVTSALVLLSIWEVPGLHRFPLWYPIIVFSRDAVLLIGAVVLHVLNGRVEVRPNFAGKSATAVNLAAISSAMLGAAWLPFHPLVWTAGGLTAFSFALYLVDGVRQLHDGQEGRTS